MNTIKSFWESYQRAALPCAVTAAQRQETRRAFYAGAHAALTCVLALGDDSVSDEAAEAALEALSDECRAFVADVIAEKA